MNKTRKMSKRQRDRNFARKFHKASNNKRQMRKLRRALGEL